jgi:hypothetical protein
VADRPVFKAEPGGDTVAESSSDDWDGPGAAVGPFEERRSDPSRVDASSDVLGGLWESETCCGKAEARGGWVLSDNLPAAVGGSSGGGANPSGSVSREAPASRPPVVCALVRRPTGGAAAARVCSLVPPNCFPLPVGSGRPLPACELSRGLALVSKLGRSLLDSFPSRGVRRGGVRPTRSRTQASPGPFTTAPPAKDAATRVRTSSAFRTVLASVPGIAAEASWGISALSSFDPSLSLRQRTARKRAWPSTLGEGGFHPRWALSTRSVPPCGHLLSTPGQGTKYCDRRGLRQFIRALSAPGPPW